MSAEAFLLWWFVVGLAGWGVWLRRAGCSRWWLDLASGVLVVGWMGPLVWVGVWVSRPRAGV